MSELIKREDAISRKELLDYINDHREDFSDYNGYSQMFDFVDAMPTVDAVPVVRCGECKHRIGTIYARDGMTILKVCELKHGTNNIDFYCKDGERDESCHTSRY